MSLCLAPSQISTIVLLIQQPLAQNAVRSLRCIPLTAAYLRPAGSKGHKALWSRVVCRVALVPCQNGDSTLLDAVMAVRPCVYVRGCLLVSK